MGECDTVDIEDSSPLGRWNESGRVSARAAVIGLERKP